MGSFMIGIIISGLLSQTAGVVRLRPEGSEFRVYLEGQGDLVSR